MRLVVAGCSRRKSASSVPVPALDLYQGGCIPALRARMGGDPSLRSCIRILSARHGLVPADQPLMPYDQPLDLPRAVDLRGAVVEALRAESREVGWPEEILAVLEPLYMVCLGGLLALRRRPVVRWVPDPCGGWAEACEVLDEWGW